MFETVVMATDGGESTERAIEAALDLTERFDADLHALTVIDANEEEKSDTDSKKEKRATAQSVLDDLAAHTNREVYTAIEEGDPAAVICSYAKQVDADMIAMGTRGRDGPYKFHLGSVAEAVVHDCPVPVFTVRQIDAAVEQSSNESEPESSSKTDSPTVETDIESLANDG